MSDDLAIDVRGLSKRFVPRTVVDRVDIQVRHVAQAAAGDASWTLFFLGAAEKIEKR